MLLELRVKMNEKLYLRDPEGSELGRKIVRQGIVLIAEKGFEDFTFRKLSEAINTTEASIYRYFENKHRLLMYIITWYWNAVEYLVVFHINNMTVPEKKIKKVIELLAGDTDYSILGPDVDTRALFDVVMHESNKVYLTKDVTADNKNQLFKPYKDLCGRIAGLISEYNPNYKYPRSLASTLVEMSHLQYFFMQNLPSLTDFGQTKKKEDLKGFLEQMVLSNIKTAK